jgi:hypothetical protein
VQGPASGTAGTVNTGGGAGGGGSIGGAGGSGIVIVRFASSFTGGVTSTGTANTTSAPGYTVHTFTGPGTFTTNANFGIAATYSVN